MNWLEKTHGVQFELVRHFLRRMFDGEWSSAPGQWGSAAIGILSLFLPAGLLLVREGATDPRYASKYRLLELAGQTDAIHSAAMADQIALLTLLMCVTGLIALFEWQSLFPSGRDYLALASLPVRSRQIFTARFTSVLLFSAVIVSALNFLPSLLAPIEFGGGWRFDSTLLQGAGMQAAASGLACFFVFFAILALQGILLNVLPANLFARASVYVQGALVGLFLLGGFYSWSIKEWTPATIDRLPEFGAWLPPIWFAGLHRSLSGSGEPFSDGMARRALMAAAIAIALSLLTYFVSYRRYRKLLLEAPVRLTTATVWRWGLLRLLARSPRREALMEFMATTLARSRTHRLLWLAYIGAAIAVMLNSSLIDGAIFMRSKGWGKAVRFLVLFWPLACSVVVLNGFRHVLSIPAELRANWIFQITESQGRAEWMSAVERFVIAYAIAPIYLILAPVATYVLGWPMALRMTILQVILSMTIFEALFHSWQKLPFACAYIPGKRPLVGIVGGYIAMLCAIVPILSVLIAVASQVSFLFPVYIVNFGAIWIWLRRLRREGWGETKLIYEELPVVVTDLGIKELTYAGTEAQLRRTAARDAGHADPENFDSRTDARVRGGGVYPADIGGRAASGGGSALPGTAPVGTAWPAQLGVGRFGEPPAGEVLPTDGGRPQTTGRRSGPLAEDLCRDRTYHGAGLRGTRFGEFCSAAWLRLRSAIRRRQLDRDLDDELAFHLAMREEQNRSAGASPVVAHDAAQRQFGNATSIREACRDLWTLGWLEAWWQDVRYGCRQVRLNRGYAIAASATLGLGIAATATIYSVCNAFVWKTPPLPHPEQLVAILEAVPGNAHFWNIASPADVEDIRRSQTTLQDIASWENGAATIVDGEGEAMRVDLARVTPNLFDVLGVSPALGRVFAAGADQVILSDGLWRRRFQADPAIVGKAIRLNDQAWTVAGVMPPDFAFPRVSKELWTPLSFTPVERSARDTPRIDSVGRLKPGRTVQDTAAELTRLGSELEKQYPRTNTNRRFMVWPIRRYLVGDYAAQFATLLLGAALFVLLIACSNVANLQFARGTARGKEVAVRRALGASRSRIVSQLVTESIVLALAGGALGVTLARFGLHAIESGIPPELRRYSTAWTDLGLNPRVLLFALAAAVLSGIVAALWPALRASRPDLTGSLKEGGHRSSAGLGRHRVRSLLLAGEMALTVVLLLGAGLMIKGFHNLMQGERSIEPATVLTLRLEFDTDRYRAPERRVEFYSQALERMAALPGVVGATAASALPYSRHARFTRFSIPGRTFEPNRQPHTQVQAVAPGYFEAMHIPLRSGRFLNRRDGAQTTPSAVISEEAARQWWPGESTPVGKQFQLEPAGPAITIVGVVGGIRASVLDRVPRPTLYVPYAQRPEPGMEVAIRTAGDPLALATSVRTVIAAMDPGQPVSEITTLARMKENEVIGLNYTAMLMSAFGAAGLLLSCVGLYGMTTYLVSGRTHEIGVRIALGATRSNIFGMLFRQGSRPVLAGMAVGLVLAFGLARLLASIIWGVSATDARTFVAVPLLLAAAIGLAIYLPARRAMKIDPSAALRND